MVRQNRLAIGLSVSAVLACAGAAVWIGQSPIMRGGRHPSLGEAAGMAAVPAIAAAIATWAAWRNKPLLLVLGTALLGLFVFVTGFSIGGAFLPAFGLLVWGTFASVADRPARQESSV